MKKALIALVIVAVAAGCTQSDTNTENATAELTGEVSDSTITRESPGELTLNAHNYGNESEFFVEVRPVGDYRDIVEITNRQRELTNRVNLGSAVKGATTGERFAKIRKRLNITSTARVEASLYREGSEEPVDTKTYVFRLKEDG